MEPVGRIVMELGWSKHSDWRRGSSSQDMEQVDSTEMELGWSKNCDWRRGWSSHDMEHNTVIKIIFY